MVSFTPRQFFTSGKDPVPIVQKAGWDPGPVWTGAENLALTVIRSPDRPARSQSLYKAKLPGPPDSLIKVKLLNAILRMLSIYIYIHVGHAVAQLVEALRYKSEGRGFDSR
jgi:hypothetical protein